MGMKASIVIALLGFAAGCDSKATASDPQGAGAGAEQKSKEYESCGASLHCRDELRCFDQMCRRTARSTVGDYFAAVGAAQRAKGDHEGAIAAYASALGHYDAEKLPLPPDVDCAYGGALAAGKASKDHAELGARVLHRCVLAAPVGSALRDRALVELATLGDAGLDPLLLGAPKTADLYLTKGPTKPATDKLTVAFTATPQPKAMAKISDALGAPDVRAALVACWDAYNSASKKDAMTVTIGVKSSYLAPEYEDEAGAFVLKLEPSLLAAGSPEGAADACVRQTLEATLKAAKVPEAFATKLGVTIK
jgi:hypothetical protein